MLCKTRLGLQLDCSTSWGAVLDSTSLNDTGVEGVEKGVGECVRWVTMSVPLCGWVGTWGRCQRGGVASTLWVWVAARR